MVVAGGDYVHFVVEYGGKIEKCRVTETALLNRERMSRKDAGYAQLTAIFVRHRAEIEHLALNRIYLTKPAVNYLQTFRKYFLSY